MWTLILSLFCGCGAGIITGLTPGLHVNTISIIMVSIAPMLAGFLSPIDVALFLLAMAIVHSFLDMVPSLFLGAPDPETALSVLPGHEMLLRGEGMRALKLTVVGGVGTFIVSLAALPLIVLALKPIEPFLKEAIVPVLVGFTVLFVLKEKNWRNRLWALLILLMSGCLGLLVLNFINIKDPLFPLFSGLFGLSGLILSFSEEGKIVEQNLVAKVKFGGRNWINYIKAAASSFLVSVLPGVGAAQAAGIAQGFTKFKDGEDYLVIVGGINNAGVLFALAALFLIGKPRSGVSVAMQELLQIGSREFILLVAGAFAATGIGVILTLKIGKFFAKNISKISYKLMSAIIILIVCTLVFVFSGWLGLFILTVATAVGLLPPLIGIRRIHAMGVLVVPILLYFL